MPSRASRLARLSAARRAFRFAADMKRLLRFLLAFGLLSAAAGPSLRAGTLVFTDEAAFLAAVSTAGLTNTHLNDLLEVSLFAPVGTPAPTYDFYGKPDFAYVVTTTFTNAWGLPGTGGAAGDTLYAPGGALTVTEVGESLSVVIARSNVFALGARVFASDFDTGAVVNGTVTARLNDGTTAQVASTAGGPLPFVGFLTQPPTPLWSLEITAAEPPGVDHIYVAGVPSAAPTPRLGLPQRQTNGVVHLSLFGAVGWKAEFQVSTNLPEWSTLRDFAIFSSPTTITDPGATNATQRYYRAILR